jgi:hypothetical protein
MAIKLTSKDVNSVILGYSQGYALFPHPGRRNNLGMYRLVYSHFVAQNLEFCVLVDGAEKKQATLFDLSSAPRVVSIHVATGTYKGVEFDNRTHPDYISSFMEDDIEWVLFRGEANLSLMLSES